MDFVVNNHVVVLSTNSGVHKNFKEILESRELSSSYLLGEMDGTESPVLITQSQEINFAKLYKFMMERGENSLDTLSSKYDSQFSQYNITVRDLYKASILFKNYIAGTQVVSKIEVPPSNYTSGIVADRVKLVLGTSSVDKTSPILLDPNNVTIERGPSDFDKEVMYRVPSVDELKVVDNLSTIMPQQNELQVYNNPAYSTVLFRQHLDNDADLLLVTGQATNNKFSLYDEEKRYAETLSALISDALETRMPLVESLMLQYVKDLALYAANKNYNHTGFMPIVADEDDEYDEDNDVGGDDSNEVTSRNSFEKLTRTTNASQLIDGMVAIDSVIQRQYDIDPMGVPSIVIQLFRYGNRKPTRLEFSDGTFFDLVTFTGTEFSGDLSSYEPIIAEDGSQISVVGLVTLGGKLLEKETYNLFGVEMNPVDIPIGIVGYRSFNGVNATQDIFFTFEDLIKGYQAGDSRVYCDLIKLVDGKLVCLDGFEELPTFKLEDAVSSVRGSRDGLNVFYSSPDFISTFVTVARYTNIVSRLSIISEYINATYLSDTISLHSCDVDMIKDIAVELKVSPIQVLKLNLLKESLGFILSANNEFVENTDGTNVSAVNCYNNVAFREVSKEEVTEMASVLFDDEESVEIMKKVSEYLLDPAYNSGASTLGLYINERQAQVISSKIKVEKVSDGKYLLGKIRYDKETKTGLLLSASSPENVSTGMSFKSLVPIVLQCFKDLARDKDLKYRFENREVLDYYATALNMILKDALG